MHRSGIFEMKVIEVRNLLQSLFGYSDSSQIENIWLAYKYTCYGAKILFIPCILVDVLMCILHFGKFSEDIMMNSASQTQT